MTPNLDDIQVLRQKLLFRSQRRGFKEADLIIGQFCHIHIDALTLEELLHLEAFLDAPDLDSYGWIIGQKEVPNEWQTPLLKKIQDFYPTLHKYL